MKVKQVILMRTDLNMRKGKMIAQGAHASMKILLDKMSKINNDNWTLELDENISEWLNGLFTKICLQVNSKEELLEIYQKALDNGFPASLIIDAGLTEFHGIPTETCIAIGPAKSEDIDKITKNLKLL